MPQLKSRRSPTGLGGGKPILGGGPLCTIGDLPQGGILAQEGNSCGTCSLSAILGHFGIEATQKEIDRQIRNANIFTAPDLVLRYARQEGMEAVFRNHGSAEELKRLIDRGTPVVLLVDTQPHNALRPLHLHYVTALSYRIDDGFHLGVYNPWGLREELDEDGLDMAWSDVHVGPFICWNRAYIAIGPKGSDLGSSRRRGSVGINLMGLSIANLVNGVAGLLRAGHRSRSAGELLSFLPQLAAGLAAFVFEQAVSMVSSISGERRGPRCVSK